MTTAEFAAHKAAGDSETQVSLHSGKHESQNFLQPPDSPPPKLFIILIIYSFIFHYPSFCIKSLVLFSPLLLFFLII